MEVRRFGVDVIQVEPAAVRTGFPEATMGLFDERVGRPPSPYRSFPLWQRRLVVAALRARPLASTPESVAAAVLRALDAARPRTRYRPSAVAHLDVLARRLAPDRLWDAVFRTLSRG